MKQKLKEKLKKSIMGRYLQDVRNLVNHPKREILVWIDFFSFYFSASNFRKEQKRKISSKKTLLLYGTGQVYKMKLEGMLLRALELLDGTGVVLIHSRLDNWAYRYFRALGIENFLYQEDLEKEAEFLLDSEVIQFLESGNLDFKKIKDFEWKNGRLGAQALGYLCRVSHQGSFNLEDQLFHEKLKEVFKTLCKNRIISKKIYERIMPDHILVNEANGLEFGPFVDEALEKKIDIIQQVQPSRDDALIFKRMSQKTRNCHPNSLSVESLNQLKKNGWSSVHQNFLDEEFDRRYSGHWFLQKRNQPNTRDYTKSAFLSELKLDPQKKTVVIFAHILWDANLFYGEDLFKDFEEWFVETVKAANENPYLNWIIKMHPANLWKRDREQVDSEFAEVSVIKESIGNLNSHVALLYPDSNISTLSLFKNVDFAITVRGTSGLEAPCFGVKTLTGGTGRYSGLGFTTDFETKDDYLAMLKKLEHIVPMTQEEIKQAKLHAYGLFKLRPWVFHSFKTFFKYQKRGAHPLDHNLMINKNSNFEDFTQLGEWFFENQSLDFLNME